MSQGGGLATTSYEAILQKVPTLLTPAEKALPDEQRNIVVKNKLQVLLKSESIKKSQNAQNGSAGVGGQRPVGNNVRPPPQMQQGGSGQGMVAQSPRMVMPQQQGQIQGQGQGGQMVMPGQGQMNGQQQVR